MTYPFHIEVQRYFPDFDYNAPAGDRSVLCDMRNPGNMVGHQQRAFSCFWALRTCSALDLGLDFGSPRGLTPHCMHVDIYGDGRVHPFYGGGAYLADIARSAIDTSIFPRGAFPFVNSNHSIEHMDVPGDGGIVCLLSDWLSMLRVGGVLALVVPDNAHFDVMASDKDHKHAWTASEFRARVLEPMLTRGSADLLEFDTLQNHFSFNAVLRRR